MVRAGTGPGRSPCGRRIGGAISSLGPLIAGALLEHFWWGSVFLVTLPLAVVALLLACVFVPAHVNETTDPVDNLGGILSVVLVASLVLAINFAPVPDEGTLRSASASSRWPPAVAFVIRQRRAANPLYDLEVAARRIFWVAAVAGIIVFGTLMGAMFIGQQFLQNVLGYSTLEAGAAILPAAVFMVLIAPRSAKLVESHGARFTLLVGYVFCLLGFVTMLLLWDEGAAYWQVGLGYAFVGAGVGFAGTPASHSLTGSVPGHPGRHGVGHGGPPARPGRRHHAVDPRRAAHCRLRGGRRRCHRRRRPTPTRSPTACSRSCRSRSRAPRTSPSSTRSTPTRSSRRPKTSFLDGADWAYIAGIVAIVLGAILVFFMFPKKDDEVRLLAQYAEEDALDLAAE